MSLQVCHWIILRIRTDLARFGNHCSLLSFGRSVPSKFTPFMLLEEAGTVPYHMMSSLMDDQVIPITLVIKSYTALPAGHSWAWSLSHKECSLSPPLPDIFRSLPHPCFWQPRNPQGEHPTPCLSRDYQQEKRSAFVPEIHELEKWITCVGRYPPFLNYQPWEMGRGDYIPDMVFQEYPGIPELWEIIFGQKSPMFLSLLLTLLIASVYWTGQSRTRCHLSPNRPGHSGKSLYMQSIPFLTL